MKLSVRAKGFVMFALLVSYIGIAGFVLNSERARLLAIGQSLEQLHEREAALSTAAGAVNNSMLRMQVLLHSATLGSSFGDDLALDVELIQSALQTLQVYFPELDGEVARLGTLIAQLRAAPSRSGILELGEAERVLDRRLKEIDGAVRERRTALWAEYHRVYDRMTLLALIMNLVGVIVFGALTTLFFTRLAWDIRKVGTRAADIVSGFRGPPLDVTRDDEVGELMASVNTMAHELRQREHKLEIAREQRFHRERMASIGSVAAAVAHEINNPIAAIAGVARTVVQAQASGRPLEAQAAAERAQLILDQAQRITGISRQIAEFTRPRPASPELLDLNSLVRSTCTFMGYDRRLQDIDVRLELDPQVPAIRAVADHITQVLMNLVINSADALEGAKGDRTIRVATALRPDGVEISVADAGIGMDEATLAHAFDEAFSTKPADRGRGLGLYVSRQLILQGGGTIHIESAPGRGAVATVRLPLRAPVPA